MAQKITLLIIMLWLNVACFVPPAAANWSYTTSDDGYWQGTHYNYTKIVFNITNANKSYFTAVPVSNFSVAGWTSTQNSATQATATGTPVTGSMTWRLNFTKGMPANFSYNYYLYTGNTAVAAYSMTLASGSWTRTAIPVPLPATLLLLGSGLLGIFFIRRKLQIR